MVVCASICIALVLCEKIHDKFAVNSLRCLNEFVSPRDEVVRLCGKTDCERVN
jgi:hypothetical protein